MLMIFFYIFTLYVVIEVFIDHKVFVLRNYIKSYQKLFFINNFSSLTVVDTRSISMVIVKEPHFFSVAFQPRFNIWTDEFAA